MCFKQYVVVKLEILKVYEREVIVNNNFFFFIGFEVVRKMSDSFLVIDNSVYYYSYF